MKIEHTYITTGDSLTVYIDGNSYTVNNKNANYDKIVKALKKGKSNEKIIELFDTAKAIKTYCKGKVQIRNGVLFYDNDEIRNSLTVKILRMMEEEFPIEPMVKFFENLRENPSKAAQDELMLFMEANEMPITPDGHFLSYKSVREDYKDFHSRTFDNSIGKVCEMARLDVDDNRQNTCSNGLHIGAKDYAGNFGGGGHLMVVKVNPRDVVSIPYDYNNMKGRVCRYEVIGEVLKATEGKDAFNQTSVYDDSPDDNRDADICPNCSSIMDDDDDGYYCPSCGYEG